MYAYVLHFENLLICLLGCAHAYFSLYMPFLSSPSLNSRARLGSSPQLVHNAIQLFSIIVDVRKCYSHLLSYVCSVLSLSKVLSHTISNFNQSLRQFKTFHFPCLRFAFHVVCVCVRLEKMQIPIEQNGDQKQTHFNTSHVNRIAC